MKSSIYQKLQQLYGTIKAKKIFSEIEKLVWQSKNKVAAVKGKFWDEKDIALIVYADSFQEKNLPTLKSLYNFLEKYLGESFSIIHILPFFPYSSDRGFSVIDFYQVKKEFGSWEEIGKIAEKYRLMADLVLNHISTKSNWFQKFLQGDKNYWNYFIHFKEDKIPHQDLKKVYRPRPTPVLTPFDSARGKVYLWTTFSVEGKIDQVDLNYQNPQVLIEIVKILLFLLEKGVRIFRLDAVAYVWKKLGTNCLHQPQAHIIVSLLREILDLVCPSAIIITETNVPYKENISYFGDGRHEAQMVYNFTLAPLVLHSFYKGVAVTLSHWVKTVKPPFPNTTFFNFLDSHDGIGIMGAKGILKDKEIEDIFNRILDHGGVLSYRLLPDGSQTVYEMNSTWWSALNKKDDEPFDLQLAKFITSRAIAMVLSGVPAVYYLSLFGKENDLDLFKKTGIKRDINRTNLNLKDLTKILENNDSRESKIFRAMINLIEKRKKIKAFHPVADQKILELDKRVFSVVKEYKGNKILAIHNVSKELVNVSYQGNVYQLKPYSYQWIEL